MIRQHQVTPKGLGQDGLVEFRQEARGVGMLHGHTVEPREGSFNAVNDFLLLGDRRNSLPATDLRPGKRKAWIFANVSLAAASAYGWPALGKPEG
jgi:hypothetical protein